MPHVNKKRVRSVPKPKWFTKELQEAIYLRDFLKKHGQHEESNKLRNAINSQKHAAKKKYIQDLISDKNNSKSTWSAIHQLTNKASALAKSISPLANANKIRVGLIETS